MNTHPGQERSSTDRDRIADDRDRLAHERDQAAYLRELLAVNRDDAADQRDRVANERDRVADERDRVADARDEAADERDRIADDRARAAEQELVGLRTAMDTRAVIEQAKGMVMLTLKVDAEAAFDVLVRRSQNTHTKLLEVAQEIVATGTRAVD